MTEKGVVRGSLRPRDVAPAPALTPYPTPAATLLQDVVATSYVPIAISLLSRGLDFAQSVQYVLIVDGPHNMVNSLHRAGHSREWARRTRLGRRAGTGWRRRMSCGARSARSLRDHTQRWVPRRAWAEGGGSGYWYLHLFWYKDNRLIVCIVNNNITTFRTPTLVPNIFIAELDIINGELRMVCPKSQAALQHESVLYYLWC